MEITSLVIAGGPPAGSSERTAETPSIDRLALLTESRLKTFRRCQKEHFFRYQMMIQPIADSEALRFGSLVHVGEEAWWKATEFRLAAAIAAMRANAGAETDAYELVRAEEIMRGYDARWLAQADGFELIGVELEFRTHLRNPMTGRVSKTFDLAGKLDVLVREIATRRIIIIEHKTSGEDIGPGTTYWARLKLDGQISMYFKGAESLGHAPDACLYDVLGKPKIRPYKATPIEARKYKADRTLYANQRDADETAEEFRVRLREEIATNPDRYYQRGEVVRLEKETADFEWELWNMAVLMRDGQREQRAPRNPDACIRYGRSCEFFGVCTGEESLENPVLFKKLEWAHPELNRT